MKTKTKIITSIIAFILSCVILFTLAVVNPNTNHIVGASVRTVQLNNNTVDYESFFNEFDDVELVLDEDDNAIKFSGTRTIDADLFKEIDLVSLSDEDDGVDVRYVFDYNADKNEFYLSIIADTESGEIVDNWFGVPFVGDDGEIDIAFATDDGVIYLSELEENGVLENCGWFSKLFKVVAIVAAVVAVVAVVAAVAVVAGPALVAAGTAVGAAVGSAAATGGAAAAVVATGGAAAAAVATGGAAAVAVTSTTVVASAVTAAAAAGTAAMASTAFAVASTTAVVATGIAAASAVASAKSQSMQVVEETAAINPNRDVKELGKDILEKISELNLNNRVYQFAYLLGNDLIIMPNKMNYVEAYAVLLATNFINSTHTGNLATPLKDFILTDTLKKLVTTIKNDKNIKEGLVGIYTVEEIDAAKLAYAAGGFHNSIGANSETHDKREGSGYYYHFHDFSHRIHVWYGSAS